MHFKVKNYEFSDDRTWAWVDVDVEDDRSQPSAVARFSFALPIEDGQSLQEIDRAAFDLLRRFTAEIARDLDYPESLH